jgi:4-diphosphocytidyl-2-C-methyl-D-erythritol kinase
MTAPAKLNLLLGITPQIVGGKHVLTTVFSAISLADTLTFTYDDTQPRGISLDVQASSDSAPLRIAFERNIVYKAVLAMEEFCGRTLAGHLRIVVDKRIPVQGGLAGGSTDAAATLKYLAGLWGIDPLSEPVLAAASALGADVTFFLYGGCALMGGGGEQFIRALPQPKLDLVLVKPKGGVSTKAAYAAFDADPQPLPSAERLVNLLQDAGTPRQVLAQAFANNLYPAARSLMPELEALRAQLSAQPGIHAALLTGSGATVFGVCESAQVAARVAQHFSGQGYWTKACTTA